ncbi:MAG: ApbE family lipoprotein [Firmicutes bacterium]|nr:ApbE family lipoprotein [Bacillota bacterium]
MNTWITVTGASTDLAPWFEQVEVNLSRFRPDSPLCQLNRMPEHWVVVPSLLFDAIEQGLAAAEATGGAYDPTILAALEASGYSRSFELGPSPTGPSQPAGRWQDVKLDYALNAVWLPAGVRLDLGGIGKGLAVDGGLEQLTSAPRAVINAGGDLAVRTAPGDGPVRIEVAEPWDLSRTMASFGVYRGAVATSSTLGRRWGDGLHHIIDPRTGLPAASGLIAATVVAGSAAQADVLAKACIVLGAEKALPLLHTYQSEALLVTEQHELLTTPAMKGWLYANL